MRTLSMMLFLLLSFPAAAQQWCPDGRCPTSPPQYYQQEQLQPPNTLVASTVKVEANLGNGAAVVGTGVVVSIQDKTAYILTNKHVVEGGRSFRVHLVGYREPVRATLVFASPSDDLALVKIGTPGLLVSVGISDEVPTNESVWQLGHPHGGSLHVQYFVYAGNSRTLEGAPVVLFNRPIQSGESGSGVFCRGKLVALCWGCVGGQTYAVPAGRIRLFMAKVFGRQPIPLQPQQPQSPPAVPPLAPEGSSLPPVAPQPALPAGPASADLSAMEARIMARIAAIPAGKDGAAGLAGKDGLPGERGPAGKDGLPGQPGRNADNSTLEARIAVLEATINNFAPQAPVRVRVVPSANTP